MEGQQLEPEDPLGFITRCVNERRLVPHGEDPLPWHELDALDSVYVTGGDAAAIRAARRARVLVATPRAAPGLAEAHVEIDALVASGNDPGEPVDRPLDPPPRLVVRTRGAAGGEWESREGRRGVWSAAALERAPVDSYGAGDSFAAGLTYALAAGWSTSEAIALAARCGAAAVTGRGAFEGQLSLR